MSQTPMSPAEGSFMDRLAGWALGPAGLSSRHLAWVQSERGALALTLGLAFAVRLPGLIARPLWYDEAFAVLFSSAGPAAMVYGTVAVESGVAADVHPLLYYTLLWGWGGALGTSPMVVRSLSLLLGLLVVYAGYRVSRLLMGPGAALAGAFLLALSPFQVHYALEVRMYALLGVLLLAATFTFWKGSNTGRARWWLAFGVLAAAAQYTHNLAAMYMIALSGIPILRRRWKDAAWTAAAGLLALALYFPWLLRLPGQMARVGAFYWIGKPGLTELVRTLLVYVTGLPLPEWALATGLFLALLILTFALLATLRGVRRNAPGATQAAWLAYLAVAPIGLMFLASQWSPVYLDRAMLPAGACFALWLAWTVLEHERVGARLLSRTSAAAILTAYGLGLYGFFAHQGFPYAPYEELVDVIRREREVGDVILHSNKITAIPAAYYAPDLEHRYVQDPPRSGSDTLAPATQLVLRLPASESAAEAATGAPGVWFVIFNREVDDYAAEGVAEHPSLTWLLGSFHMEESLVFGEVTVYHFVR